MSVFHDFPGHYCLSVEVYDIKGRVNNPSRLTRQRCKVMPAHTGSTHQQILCLGLGILPVSAVLINIMTATTPIIIYTRYSLDHCIPTAHGLFIILDTFTPYYTQRIFNRGPPPLLPSRKPEAKQIDITLLQLHSARSFSLSARFLDKKNCYYLPLHAPDTVARYLMICFTITLAKTSAPSIQSGFLKIMYAGYYSSGGV